MSILKVMYSKEISTELANLWYSRFKGLPTEVFVMALQDHMDDTSEGKFFPTFAHILCQIIGTEDDAAVRYGIEFDDKPTCDGTQSFDVQREKSIQRDMRRKRWVESNLARWRSATTERKIEYSLTLKSTQRKLEAYHARLN